MRIDRFPLSDSTYECLVTNFSEEEFPPDRLKGLYFSRWDLKSSFQKLKYTIGLINFHSYKPDYIKQEIWVKLTAYNLTESIINHTVVTHQKDTKHDYKVNFSAAAHICRVFLRPYKTGFIKEWWESWDDVTPITRPRRFGKTVMMSMVEHFFSVNHTGSHLFETLGIWKEECYRKLQGTYSIFSTVEKDRPEANRSVFTTDLFWV